jgi:hypothetical protein
VNHGANFFAGGYVTTSIGSQIVVFPDISSAVDARSVRYVFSADLGGFASQDDKAAVTMQFANQIGSGIGTVVTLDGPNASGRANHTGFLHVTQTGPVPANARGAYITLTLSRLSTVGPYNDGYADNISLVLLPPTLFLPVVRN